MWGIYTCDMDCLIFFQNCNFRVMLKLFNSEIRCNFHFFFTLNSLSFADGK